MSDGPADDALFTLAERALMLAGVLLLVVALVMAVPLGFLSDPGSDGGDEAAAADTPTPEPDRGTPGAESAPAADTPAGSSTGTDAETPTMGGPRLQTETPGGEETHTPTGEPTPTAEATPTETDDGPGIGPPDDPPGRDDD